MLGSNKEKGKQGVPTLKDNFKSEAYESEDDYEDLEDGLGPEGAFRLRREEEYEQD